MKRRRSFVVRSLAGVLLLVATARGEAQENALVARGRYVFGAAGGCACHTDPKGTRNAGGRAFPTPFGTVYSTNLTSDRETGLGSWTDSQIGAALTRGVRPDGSRILPVMPYEAYSGMAREDLNALIAYLRTLKPVRKATSPLRTRIPFLRGLGVPLWLKLFGRFSSPPDRAPRSGVERGRYLVDHVAVCGDCHTPRNALGAPKRSLYLAGVDQAHGPLGEAVPNITPDKETGIGTWKREEIAELLLTGTKPDLDNVQGLMAEVVEGVGHGYKDLTREDALAIADYLKTVPAIKNKID
ncbi:MAG TPA: cytochrome c [candidate division Zixibacteria bacterium]|nr:cytochrome c [candidate division Zixibacteria bacterium]